jgi:hypothetical protein
MAAPVFMGSLTSQDHEPWLEYGTVELSERGLDDEVPDAVALLGVND